MHVTTGRAWDGRRNTSATHSPGPAALAAALAACRALRRSDPQLVAWVESGYPTLTEDEHARRFGAAYKRK